MLTYDTIYQDTKMMQSDHAARLVRGIATREGIFKAGGGTPALVGKRIYRPGDLLQKFAGSLIGKNLYLGVQEHPETEDDTKASGKIVESFYDPGSKSVKYAAKVDETRVCPDIMKILDSGGILPNSVRSMVHVDWTPGTHPVYGPYDGKEVFIDFKHVSEVENAACPAGTCGIGLHCSCDKKEMRNLAIAHYPGTVDPSAIDAILASAGSMDPAKAAEQALGMLASISDHMKNGKGVFAPAEVKYPIPNIDEAGNLVWGETSDHKEAKHHTEAALNIMSKALAEEKRHHSEAATKLKGFEEKEKAETEAKKKALIAKLSTVDLFKEENARKLLDGMDITHLETLALGVPEDSQHESHREEHSKEGRPKFSAPPANKKDAGIEKIGLFTSLSKEQQLALRAQFEQKTGRPLIPTRAGIQFGNPDLKPGAK